MSDPILPSQCSAARALIGWSQEHLANSSGVSLSTIKDFEVGRRDTALTLVIALRDTLKRAGIRFISLDKAGGPGVRLDKKEIRPYRVFSRQVKGKTQGTK